MCELEIIIFEQRFGIDDDIEPFLSLYSHTPCTAHQIDFCSATNDFKSNTFVILGELVRILSNKSVTILFVCEKMFSIWVNSYDHSFNRKHMSRRIIKKKKNIWRSFNPKFWFCTQLWLLNCCRNHFGLWKAVQFQFVINSGFFSSSTENRNQTTVDWFLNC